MSYALRRNGQRTSLCTPPFLLDFSRYKRIARTVPGSLPALPCLPHASFSCPLSGLFDWCDVSGPDRVMRVHLISDPPLVANQVPRCRGKICCTSDQGCHRLQQIRPLNESRGDNLTLNRSNILLCVLYFFWNRRFCFRLFFLL